MARLLLLFLLIACTNDESRAQENVIAPGKNLVVKNAPGVPTALAEKIGRYSEYREAVQADWHPIRREMVIETRFGNTYQAHIVKMPGGAREQLTFFPEPVRSATYHPRGGDYLLLQKDAGGSEWFQYYRLDPRTGDSTLLTDGKSRNTAAHWSSDGDRIAYVSTRRTGQDADLWTMNPAAPESDRLLTQLSGGGWEPQDWSPDDHRILLMEGISVNESHLWLVDAVTGEKTELTPRMTDEQVAYGSARFSKDGKGVYVTTDKNSEFKRLAYIDLATKRMKIVTPEVRWDVDEFQQSWNGRWIAFLSNEDGFSRIHLLDAATAEERPVPRLPTGLMYGLIWHRNNRDLGFNIQTGSAQADCYSLDASTGKLERWTNSESAVRLSGLPEAKLVNWKSFDGRSISGILYQPAAQFTGKRPVLIDIHGGPEAQSRPWFLGTENYYRNDLGIAIILPNVRGSTGYGKKFAMLDNGLLREGSYKDINALLDWIATQPNLDAERVAVTGASYGGYMTLAVSAFFGDRIRCAVDVVGPSNFVTFLENTEAYRRDLRRVEYGDERDPDTRSFLERIAPLNNLAKITKPLLVVAGRNDPQVPLSESKQIVEALQAQGTPVWYLMAQDEGHGFQKKENLDYEFFTSAQFLTQCLVRPPE
jgi:dipeptidyl aminopeptidase/acylaminoacyl peptidase